MFVTRRRHRRQVERLQGDLDRAWVIIEGQRRAIKSLQERIAELEAEIKHRNPEMGDLK